MIIPIKEEQENLEKLKKTYTPDFVYKFDTDEWRFTANDGDFIVIIKISKGFIVIGVEETDYDFFFNDGHLVGLVNGAEDPTTTEMMTFFGWEDIDGTTCE